MMPISIIGIARNCFAPWPTIMSTFAVSKMVEGAGPMIQIERDSSVMWLMKRLKEIA